MQGQNPYDRGYFPDPVLSSEEGILAVGGSLDIPVLLEAYSRGIFPWYSEGSPLIWWSPDPRMVLFPERLKISKSMQQTLRKKTYEVRMDTAFTEVIEFCSKVPREGQEGTWITPEMKSAYIGLHEEGYAHSVESYIDGELAGGLYGVSLGGMFFGESMFHLKRDASKVALYHLIGFLKHHGFDLVDVQQSTPHMQRLGAEEIPRSRFLEILNASIPKETIPSDWDLAGLV
jgi:leucyl/phenylalanyl-tRNA--protein transferase